MGVVRVHVLNIFFLLLFFFFTIKHPFFLFFSHQNQHFMAYEGLEFYLVFQTFFLGSSVPYLRFLFFHST